MAVAGLYPVWGALWGGLATAWFLRQPHSVLVWLPFLWLAVACIEWRFFAPAGWWHILGAAEVLPFWFFFYFFRTDPARLLPAALAAHTVSRTLVIVMLWISRPTAAGMVLSQKMDSVAASFAIVCGGITSFLFGSRPGLIIMLVGFLTLRLVRQRFYDKHGGINTTALSITQHATELTTLLITVLIH